MREIDWFRSFAFSVNLELTQYAMLVLIEKNTINESVLIDSRMGQNVGFVFR